MKTNFKTPGWEHSPREASVTERAEARATGLIPARATYFNVVETDIDEFDVERVEYSTFDGRLLASGNLNEDEGAVLPGGYYVDIAFIEND